MLKKYIICFVSFLLFSLPTQAKYHIIIDPGHGGKDVGAIRGKIKESAITLTVASQLAKELKQHKDFSFSMTRQTNKSVSLEERSKFAHDRKGDIFISIHANSSYDTRVKGSEFYFENQLPPDEESLYLANKENANEVIGMDFRPSLHSHIKDRQIKHILDDLNKNMFIQLSAELAYNLGKAWKREFGKRKRRLRQAPFHVVSTVNMPSVLVELGYITNPVEGLWLLQRKNHRRIAKSIVKGLEYYKEVLDKSRR